jgi:anthranilate phosphoribosyltransferase
VIESLIRTAIERPLSVDEAEAAFGELMDGRASPVQISALLVAMRVRGVTSEEVAGGVRALRRVMVAVPVPAPAEVVDTCGTGGGGLSTFNISTAAALVAAAAGVRVAKHGNRSFTSRCGSADILEAFGVRLDLSPAAQARILEDVGIVFMFAPLHHPAMRHVAPVRRELAMPTVMNVLGPLTNPAGARRQVVGVADPALMELIAGGLRLLGHERALVVHGQPGLDELSPLGPTTVIELKSGELSRWSLDPQAELGWEPFEAGELAGGSPDENAATVRGVLRGEIRGAPRAATLLNAAAAIYVSGMATTLREGIDAATAAIDGGGAWDRLAALREASRNTA